MFVCGVDVAEYLLSQSLDLLHKRDPKEEGISTLQISFVEMFIPLQSLLFSLKSTKDSSSSSHADFEIKLQQIGQKFTKYLTKKEMLKIESSCTFHARSLLFLSQVCVFFVIFFCVIILQ